MGRLRLPMVDQRTLDRVAAAGLLAMGWVEAATAPAGTSRWLQAGIRVRNANCVLLRPPGLMYRAYLDFRDDRRLILDNAENHINRY